MLSWLWSTQFNCAGVSPAANTTQHIDLGKPWQEPVTCLAASKLCMVMEVPYEAFLLMLQGRVPGEGVMNNQV